MQLCYYWVLSTLKTRGVFRIVHTCTIPCSKSSSHGKMSPLVTAVDTLCWEPFNVQADYLKLLYNSIQLVPEFNPHYEHTIPWWFARQIIVHSLPPALSRATHTCQYSPKHCPIIFSPRGGTEFELYPHRPHKLLVVDLHTSICFHPTELQICAVHAQLYSALRQYCAITSILFQALHQYCAST